jgi:hypothetical protein
VNTLLNLNIIDGPLVWALAALATVVLLVLVIRRVGLNWYGWLLVAILGGAALAALSLWLLVDELNLFGGPLLRPAVPWVFATFAAVGIAVLSLFYRANWVRRTIAIIAVPLFAALGVIGVNGVYGLQTTLGEMLHINTKESVQIIVPPTAHPTTANPSADPLYIGWTPPADLPATGTHGPLPVDKTIPATNSGFAARPAEIYYPPAALVANPPTLPFVLMMMGQPGDPDSKWIAGALDAIAAENNGLAPIVLVVDQLGDPAVDPLCIDGKFGNVETYITKDVLPWVRSNLHVSDNRALWTVAGYSAGGSCALYYGSKYPQTWGNIVSISGEEYAGSDVAADALQAMFSGDQAAYDTIKPANILSANSYPDSVAFFSSGADDPHYQTAMAQNASLTGAAGLLTGTFLVPGADHGVSALTGGLDQTFRALYPRLGLAAPPAG